MIQSGALPVDDWYIRNHFLLNHTVQDSESSWILLWGDEQNERALKRKFPKMTKIKKAFTDYVNKQKNVYKTICTFPITTIGVGNPNAPQIEVTFKVWNTDFESWCIEDPVKNEAWDRIIVLELCKVLWKGNETSALIFCIC